ncbi:MAG: ABC transporter permease [Endomicrobia bacterium]|nr:ABC transporter permease [Endomicrobiia bacterium]
MNFKPLKNVIIREIKYFLKSPDLLLVCVGAPVLFALLFSVLYHNKRASDINIGIVNTDNSSMSRKLVRDFDASAELKVAARPLSAHEAYEDIFHKGSGGFYFIPKNFSADLKKGKSTFAFNAADSSSFIISGNVLKKFSAVSASFSQEQFTKLLVDKGYSYKAAKASFNPIKIDARYLFNAGMNYSDFLIPGLLFAVLQQILLVAICTAFISDKEKKRKKTLLKISGGSFAVIFFGKTAPYALTAVLLAAVYALTAFPANGIFIGSFAGYFILSAAFIIAVSSFGVFISSFFRSQEMAMAVLMFYAMPAVLLSGFAWPHHALHPVLKTVSYLFPSTYSLNELRLFILGDIPVKYAIMPSISLIIFAAVFFVFSYFIYKKSLK